MLDLAPFHAVFLMLLCLLFARCTPRILIKAGRLATTEMPCAADDDPASSQEAHQALVKPTDILQNTAQAQAAKAAAVATGKQHRGAELQPGSPLILQAASGASGEIQTRRFTLQPYVPLHTYSFLLLNALKLLELISIPVSLTKLVPVSRCPVRRVIGARAQQVILAV